MTSPTTTPSERTTGSEASAGNASRARRADARRNQERVLAAAEEAFATYGMSVPVDEIARRAGLGVGTVYRHFPTKAALLEAVVRAHLTKFVERAKQLCQRPDATEALFTLVAELVQLAVDKKDLVEEMAQAGVAKEAIHATAKEELDGVISELWRRAQQEGSVRADLEPDDLGALISATCMAADHRGRAATVRLVGVMCDGLRAGPLAAAAPHPLDGDRPRAT